MKKILKRIAAGMLAFVMVLTGTGGSFGTVKADESQEFTWRQTTADRLLYYDEECIANIGVRYQNETLDEILQMVEDPTVEVSFDTFFTGTIFEGCGPEELQYFKEEGLELDELVRRTGEAGMYNVLHYIYGISPMAEYRPLVADQTSDTASKSYIKELNYAKKFWTERLYSASGTSGIAFCMDKELHLQDGSTYTYSTTGPAYAGRAINWYLQQTNQIGRAHV